MHKRVIVGNYWNIVLAWGYVPQKVSKLDTETGQQLPFNDEQILHTSADKIREAIRFKETARIPAKENMGEKDKILLN